MKKKVKTFQEIKKILQKLRKKGMKIVQCHGVFDLLHPGHIRHLKEAKKKGDKLVVTITPDKFVNKGPKRPAFIENLRAETLASLNCVDYVILNDTEDAISAIEKIQPDVYVKGKEYQNHQSDVTGKIIKEVEAVQKYGGVVHYSDDIVFSSSSLLNRYLPESQEIVSFMKKIKKKYSVEELKKKIEDLSHLKVLIIGDAILDEYQYVKPLGQSGKGLHMVAACLDREVFLGGALILANHVAQFTKNVTLITNIGRECPYRDFIQKKLASCIQVNIASSKNSSTLLKKRYVLRDGNNLSKLFETYSTDISFAEAQEKRLSSFFDFHQPYDLVLIGDFGNGFIHKKIRKKISKLPHFLAINTQINSGNRGYHVISHYDKADYISLNEPEIRLAAHDHVGPLSFIVANIKKKLKSSAISVTKGVHGVDCFYDENKIEKIPAFVTNAVDRVGAGDSYFALSALCFANNYPALVSAFFGALAASLDVRIIGNKEPVKKEALLKFLIRLMK